MKLPQRCTEPFSPPPSTYVTGKSRIAAAVTAFALLICPGTHSRAQSQPPLLPSGCIGYCSDAPVIGAAVGIAAIATVGIVLAVNHSHHTLTGCVASGPTGPEIQVSGSKTYSLEGDPSVIKIGDKVKLHGSRVKGKGAGKPDEVFRVEKLTKNYGPCHGSASAVTGAQ